MKRIKCLKTLKTIQKNTDQSRVRRLGLTLLFLNVSCGYLGDELKVRSDLSQTPLPAPIASSPHPQHPSQPPTTQPDTDSPLPHQPPAEPESPPQGEYPEDGSSPEQEQLPEHEHVPEQEQLPEDQSEVEPGHSEHYEEENPKNKKEKKPKPKELAEVTVEKDEWVLNGTCTVGHFVELKQENLSGQEPIIVSTPEVYCHNGKFSIYVYLPEPANYTFILVQYRGGIPSIPVRMKVKRIPPGLKNKELPPGLQDMFEDEEQ